MPDTDVVLVAEPPAKTEGDCYCAWLNEYDIKTREATAAAVELSRKEAIRLLTLAEELAGKDSHTLMAIAMAWKDLGRLH